MDDANTGARSRRALLGSAVAAAAAAAAGALARPGRALAGADDNADMFVGISYGDVEGTTGLKNFRGSTTVFKAESTGTGIAVHGMSGNGYGVLGAAAGGTGVRATSTSGTGVSVEAGGVGILSYSGGNAVIGQSTGGFGLIGYSDHKIAVYGLGQEDSGGKFESQAAAKAGALGVARNGSTGVHGHAGVNVPAPPASTGVAGSAEGAGTGGHFTSAAGTALRVDGRATFNRSGRASIPKNATYVDVTVPGGLASTALVLATLQAPRGTAAVAHVRVNYPTAGKARIQLNKVASTTAATPVAYFVIG